MFWFSNSLLKDIRFPPIKIHTTSTWGLIANFVVELDAVLAVKTVFRANLHNIQANGGAIQPTQSAEFQFD